MKLSFITSQVLLPSDKNVQHKTEFWCLETFAITQLNNPIKIAVYVTTVTNTALIKKE